MTPFESHLWHLPCAFKGAMNEQSRHSKSLLGELEVLLFHDGHETIDLARQESELLPFWISCSDEQSVFLPVFILRDLCTCWILRGSEASEGGPHSPFTLLLLAARSTTR